MLDIELTTELDRLHTSCLLSCTRRHASAARSARSCEKQIRDDPKKQEAGSWAQRSDEVQSSNRSSDVCVVCLAELSGSVKLSSSLVPLDPNKKNGSISEPSHYETDKPGWRPGPPAQVA